MRMTSPTLLDQALGYWWTARPYLGVYGAQAPVAPAARRLELGSDQDGWRWRGLYSPGAPQAPWVVLLHGLGSDARSVVMRRAASVAAARGWHVLRVEQATRQGGVVDHGYMALASAWSMLDEALSALAPRVGVLWVGYSMGGAALLRAWAGRAPVERRALATICAPLQPKACLAHMDRGRSALLRALMLRWLRHGEPVGSPKPRSMTQWAAQRGALQEGWQEAAQALRLPALMIVAAQDPFVPASLALPERAAGASWPPALQVRLRHGGHMSFPPRTPDAITECLDWAQVSLGWRMEG